MSRAGTILRVDLTEGKIEKEPTSKYTRDYVGGSLIGVKLVTEAVPPDVKGRDPRNMLTINTGPLTGTLLGNKCDFTTRSVKIQNNPLVTGGMGGQFPSEIKFAGYDHIAITGKADQPAYLFINNEDVEIRDAGHLWGLDTQKVQAKIKEELKDPDVQVACIGPAGENQVAFSLIVHDIQHAASQGGVGAVMGSKNLKAVAVRGTKGVKVADPDAFMRLWQEQWDHIHNDPIHAYIETLHTESLMDHGDLYGKRGLTQWGYGPDASWGSPKMKEEELLDEFQKKYRVGNLGCSFCPVQCSQNYSVPGIGNGGGMCFAVLHARYSVRNLDTKVWWKAVKKAQEYGLDYIEVFGITGWLMLCHEKGIISSEDTDGIPMEWGSEEAILAVHDKISHKEGFGAHFVDGIVGAANAIADGAGYHETMQERNISVPILPPERGAIVGGSGGAQMTQTATQLWWFEPVFDLQGLGMFAKYWGVTEEEAIEKAKGLVSDWMEKQTGYRDGWKAEAIEGKAHFYRASENITSVCDMVGHCDAHSARTPHAGGTWNLEEAAASLQAATGEPWTVERLEEASQRKRLLETSYNILCERMIGEIPEISAATFRGMNEPVKDGPFQGEEFDLEGSEQVGEEYCELRGCDPDTGVPTREALEKAGLKDLADKLEESEDVLPGESSTTQPACPM
jgi:aldehyde:ferredoxin oxidoreductase